jgi:DNA repair photolyase
VDPIIPGFTDDDSSLRELLGAITSRGVNAVAVSTLFRRPAITASLAARGKSRSKPVDKWSFLAT